MTGSRVFSLTCPLGSLGPELMATVFQPNPRSEGIARLLDTLHPYDYGDGKRNFYENGPIYLASSLTNQTGSGNLTLPATSIPESLHTSLKNLIHGKRKYNPTPQERPWTHRRRPTLLRPMVGICGTPSQHEKIVE
ncbi:hypothetical protein TNCV_64981 [Trichonephila clavipes]|nr:hypothetical protein TNCV_64981 [Trichonephila clavipes]